LKLGEVPVPSVAPVHPSRRGRFVTAALITALVASLVPATLYFLRAPEEKTTIRFDMPAPGIQPEYAAISPDGQYVAYTAQVDGKRAIWIRPIGEVQARPLVGTEDGISPFWSPDNRYIAFVAEGKLKKISVAGGPATILAEMAILPLPGTWSRDGIILFSAVQTGSSARIVRISESGGTATPVGSHLKGFADFFPQFLPDGRHFLYTAATGPPANKVELYAGSLDGGAPVHIMSCGTLTPGLESVGRFASPGYLLFVRDGILMAQRFDEKHLALAGEPVPVAEPAGPFSASAQQTLVYVSRGTGSSGTEQVVWIDRNGKRGSSVGTPGSIASLRLSPDGHRLALDQSNGGNRDVWVIDLDRGIPNRLTFDPAFDVEPRWSPDGNQILFTSFRLGNPRMFLRPSISIGTDQPLPSETPSDMQDHADDWSADGKYVVFVRAPIGDGPYANIWVKPMFGDGRPFPFAQSKSFGQRQPRVSPNGRWLAYTTNESGTYQVVVQTFPDPNGGKRQVTAQGGIYPSWRGDGRELYYLALDGKLMAVSVREEGDKLDFGDPVVLFQSPITAPVVAIAHQYDVNRDGTRFAFIANNNTNSTNPDDSSKITAVLNWTAALRKK
jgi:eukaryotic-like serine/threonine-protein kinase